MRYISPDLDNFLEAYEKYFDVWKNFEVDLMLEKSKICFEIKIFKDSLSVVGRTEVD